MPALFTVTPLSTRWPPTLFALKVLTLPSDSSSKPAPEMVEPPVQFSVPSMSSVRPDAMLSVPVLWFSAPSISKSRLKA